MAPVLENAEEAEVQDIVPYVGMPITEEELMRLPRDGRKWKMGGSRPSRQSFFMMKSASI